MALDTPDRTALALRRVATVVALVGVVAVALLVASNEPPKLTAKTLAASVEDETGSGILEDSGCRRLARKSWTCTVVDGANSGGAEYAVQVTSEHCWRAELAPGHPRTDLPRTASGCLR